MNPHFLAGDDHARFGAVFDVFPLAEFMNGNGSLMSMCDSPNDIFRAECRIAAEKHFIQCGLKGCFIDNRHIPTIIKLQANVALDPRKGIFLSDRDNHIIAFIIMIRLTRRHQSAAAFGIIFRFHLLEGHADQFAVFVFEFLGHKIVENRNIFTDRVVFFPR